MAKALRILGFSVAKIFTGTAEAMWEGFCEPVALIKLFVSVARVGRLEGMKEDTGSKNDSATTNESHSIACV